MKRLLAALILVAGITIGFESQRVAVAFHNALPTWSNWKAYSPYPVSYLSRLRMLGGWNTEYGDGLNCSGFISNAHGVAFRKSYDFYSNRYEDMTLVADLPTVRAVDESLLQPGDVAAFEGGRPGFHGIHVAAYLGGGLWADADSRRGSIATWSLSEKTDADIWFAGRVRLYRWNRPADFSPRAILSTLGKDNLS